MIYNKQTNQMQTNNIHMQHLFPCASSTFQTLSHTTFGSWWWSSIINLGFHPPFTFHHTIFKNQQLWGPHVEHVFLPLLICWHSHMSELDLPILRTAGYQVPMLGMFASPSHLLTQPYVRTGSPILRTSGYQVPTLGLFCSSLVDEAIWQDRLFNLWEPSVTMCPCGVCFPAPPACWHHQCWPVIEFWPGYQVG
jgi:hypothetical protein